MRNQHRHLPIFLLSLALAAPAVLSGAPAQALVKNRPLQQNPQYDDETNLRFEEMDTNGDGRVTRDEWRGNDRSFDVHDWNRDGMLSGDELRPGSRRRTDRDRSVRFDQLDRDNDGYLSFSEWPRDRQVFYRLDRDDDGRLSRSELADRAGNGSRLSWDQRFTEMDVNRDGRLSRSEWQRNPDAFERLDRNNDGFVSRDEFLNR